MVPRCGRERITLVGYTPTNAPCDRGLPLFAKGMSRKHFSNKNLL